MIKKKVIARELLIFWSIVIIVGLTYWAYTLYDNSKQNKLNPINEEITKIEGSIEKDVEFVYKSDEEIKNIFTSRFTFDSESFVTLFYKAYAPERLKDLDEERLKNIYGNYLNDTDSLITSIYLKYLPNEVLEPNEIDSIKARFNKITNISLSRESQIELLKKQKHFKNAERISILNNEKEHIQSSSLINLSKSDFLIAMISILVFLAYVLRFVIMSIVWAVKTTTDKSQQ